MAYLIQSFWFLILLAGAIGFLTGWWIWYREAADRDAALAEGTTAPIIPPAPPEPEPIVEAPEPEPEPEPEVVAEQPPEPVAASPFLASPNGDPDDLTKIKGVGPKLNDLLHSLGVYHFSQIAQWSEAQIAEVDGELGTFRGRIVRDRWVDQARYLAAGDFAGFEHEFGRINGHR